MARRALFAVLSAALASLTVLAPLGSAAGSSGTRTKAPTLVWAPATFLISGHGWGHGVGMSQYGALGYARNGSTYDQIVEHYYPGTTLASAGSRAIRVLLADGRKRLTISSVAPFKIRDGTGSQYELADLQVTVDPTFTVALASGQGTASLPGPVTFVAGSAPLSFAGRRYRGTLRVETVGARLRLVNSVPLESYLYGVVPCEVPHDWEVEALKAQAVVARTYALVSRKSGGSFDVYADTRSQVYRGVSAEYAETTTAVKATAGEAVHYQGTLAQTYFFSTSGGKTAAVEDVWAGSKPIPYLISVDDPYDGISPYHSWGPLVFQSQTLAKKLRIRGPISDLTTELNASGRVGAASVTGRGDAVTSVTGSAVRDALGLRSTWFEATVLALQRPATPLAYGTRITVEGRARGTTAAALESRPYGRSWQPVGPLSADLDGLFSITLRPLSTTQYRIVSGTFKGASVRFSVAPAVKLQRSASGGLRGSFRPANAAAEVELQRFDYGAWTTVATLTPGASGSFASSGALASGSYRARVSGIAGLAAGVSPAVTL
jgi:stage II sporulation protein D